MRTLARRLSLALLALLLPLGAEAARLRLCVDSNDWAPYTYPARDGLLQTLVRMAAARTGDEVWFEARPWRRCEAEVSSGLFDGVVGASEAAARTTPMLVFPRGDAGFDRTRALVDTSMVLLRLAGSGVHWDGRQLLGERGAVLYVLGYEDVDEWLAGLGLERDGGADSNELNARKMLAGRANTMAIYVDDARRLLRRPEFRGRIEAFGGPTGKAYYYLAFGQAFAARHASAAERLWDAVRTVRLSDAYRERLRRVLEAERAKDGDEAAGLPATR